MKNYIKIISSLLFLLCSISLQAQIINIPDENFKDFLKNKGIDLNKDGEIQESEALAVTNIELLQGQINARISSLIGLEHFINLKNLTIEEEAPSLMLDSLSISTLINLETFKYKSISSLVLDFSNLSKLKSFKLNSDDDLPAYVNIIGFNSNNLPELETIVCNGCNFNENIEVNYSNLNKLSFINSRFLKNLTIKDLPDQSYLEDLEYNSMDSLLIENSNICGICYFNYNKINYLSIDGVNKMSSLKLESNDIKSIKLKNLPNLSELDFYEENQLKQLSLNDFPELYSISFEGNQLSDLSLINIPAFEVFKITNTKLENLELSNFPKLFFLGLQNNSSLKYLYLKDVHSLSDFSANINPNLRYVCTDSSLVDMIKSKLSNIPFLTVNTLCTFSSGGTFFNLKGDVKLDLDNNGCDNSDIAYPDLKVKINNAVDSGYLISGTDGNFSIKLLPDTYTLEPVLEDVNYYSISPTSISITLPDSVGPSFCITPNGIHNDLTVAIIPVRAARPGFSDATYKVVYKNKGNTTQSGTFTFNYDEDKMNFISSSPIADNTGAGNVSFYFSNLKPFETRSALIAMRTNSPTDNPAVNSGDVLEFTATIIGAIDETPEDNLATLTQTVVGSFDPNDKTCLEGEIVSPELIGKNVHYLIRFENTGTANAENIVVTDYIDTAVFDISTLQITDASHTCHTQISQGNKVQFIFNDIQLPFTEPDKHGYVAFSIKLKEDLVIGDSIKNKADIFFDYNLPIETNIASAEINYRRITYIGKNQTLQGSLDIYPNPSNGQFTLELKANIKSRVQISILNVEGKTVFAKSINHQNQSNLSLDLKHLAKGIYLIKAQIKNEVVSEKVLIQ